MASRPAVSGGVDPGRRPKLAVCAFPWLVLSLWLALQVQPLQATCPPGPPTCHPANPHIFADADGKALYLTGSHIWDSFQRWGTTDPPAERDFSQYLDFLEANDHNFIRGWTWEHARWIPWSENTGTVDLTIAPLPFRRSCPASAGPALDGGPKFNLETWNEDFFTGLRDRVAAAEARGIYSSVMLFQGWSFRRPGLPGDPWRGHPFHHQNNCNGIDGDPPIGSPPTRTGNGLRVHSMQLPAITAIQRRYVIKMIETLNRFGNLLWEISNESDFDAGPADPLSLPGTSRVPTAVAWQYTVIDFIKHNRFTVELPDGDYDFEHFNPFNSKRVSSGRLEVQGGRAAFNLRERPVVYLVRVPEVHSSAGVRPAPTTHEPPPARMTPNLQRSRGRVCRDRSAHDPVSTRHPVATWPD